MSQRKSPFELVAEFVDSLGERGVVLELLIIALAIAIALLVSRHVRSRRLANAQAAGRVAELGRGSVRRLTFPLTAMLLVLVGRGVAHLAELPTQLFGITIALLGAMALIRMTVFALRTVFPRVGLAGGLRARLCWR
jgi:hypothetical protein